MEKRDWELMTLLSSQLKNLVPWKEGENFLVFVQQYVDGWLGSFLYRKSGIDCFGRNCYWTLEVRIHKLAQLKQIKFLVKTDQKYTSPRKCTESHSFCTSLWSSVTWWNVNVCYNQLQKCWGTPTKKWPFSLQIVPGQRFVSYNTDLPPPSHSNLFLQVLSMHGLVLLATLIRGGGGITNTRSRKGHLWQNTVSQ